MMRTTLTLDDDVANRLQAECRRTGQPFRRVVNEYLRIAMAQRKATQASAPFRVNAVDMGGPQPGRSYDDVGALLEEVEGVDHR
jgi:uncharacterized protein (UPF0262 family)